MKFHIVGATIALFSLASLVPCAEAGDKSGMSVPPDSSIHKRAAIPEDFRPFAAGAVTSIFVVDAVVNNTDPALRNDDAIGFRGEDSIAVLPDGLGGRPSPTLALTHFDNQWGTTAPLFLSLNGSQIWTKEFTINPPPGAAGVLGCPCDQTIDFNLRNSNLAGTFLTAAGNVFSAQSNNPTVTPGAFNYFQGPPGTAVPTNHLTPSSLGSSDQPWLLTGRRPGSRAENVYVAYDNFAGAPDMHVAVAAGRSPLNFTTDNICGFSGGGFTAPVNPGLRLAVDPRSGAVYCAWQLPVAAGAGTSQNINYMLNRSTDGGRTWTLNGSPAGIVVANADSDQSTPKFCTVNALLGGVDHVTVDPVTGDVVYVYGNRDGGTGNNRLSLVRLTPNGTGGLTIGTPVFVNGQVQSALPSVAIVNNRTVGVFYYTCDGFSLGGFPIFTAHFSTSTDLGLTFTDATLVSFLSPAVDNGNARQRVLGDYQQVKAAGSTFFGGFAANRVAAFPASPLSIIDPFFFMVTTAGR